MIKKIVYTHTQRANGLRSDSVLYNSTSIEQSIGKSTKRESKTMNKATQNIVNKITTESKITDKNKISASSLESQLSLISAFVDGGLNDATKRDVLLHFENNNLLQKVTGYSAYSQSMISLIDLVRDYCKDTEGFEVKETTRNDAFQIGFVARDVNNDKRNVGFNFANISDMERRAKLNGGVKVIEGKVLPNKTKDGRQDKFKTIVSK